ncbi:MAG: FHA domain-containing protein [Verrucomicrobia bacterium]|nr:FHA domain-containing protein [Verrucomicrobiota bacterium]
MPKLISESKEIPQLVVELTGLRMAVGRIDGNEVQVVHGSISSRHAELVLEGQEYRVRDLESTNGTRVNDEKITTAVLQDRDRLQFGQVSFRYEGAVARAALALPAAGRGFQAEIGVDVGVPEPRRETRRRGAIIDGQAAQSGGIHRGFPGPDIVEVVLDRQLPL